jgi:hypothetical protein
MEESTEGWMVASIPKAALADAASSAMGSAPCHNHNIPKRQTERNQFASLREIPPDLLLTAETLAKAGNSPGDIFRFLVSQWDEVNAKDDPPFTLTDVQNTFQGTRFERAFDATNLIAYLRQRKEDDAELDYEFTTDCVLRITVVEGVMQRMSHLSCTVPVSSANAGVLPAVTNTQFSTN